MGITVLHAAAEIDEDFGVDALRVLLESKKFNINATLASGYGQYTPLHLAFATCGKNEIVLAKAELLLAHGADVDMEDESGETVRGLVGGLSWAQGLKLPPRKNKHERDESESDDSGTDKEERSKSDADSEATVPPSPPAKAPRIAE